MKKSFFAIAAVALAAVTFVSCDNKKTAENSDCCQNEANPIDTTAVQAELVDVVASQVDTTANGVVNVENEVELTPVDAQQ